MSRFIPLSIPNFEGNERKYVDDAIDQGWVSTGGAYITKIRRTDGRISSCRESGCLPEWHICITFVVVGM